MQLFIREHIIDIVACISAVIALFYTLYFWLLDHTIDDVSKFIGSKRVFLAVFRDSKKRLQSLIILTNSSNIILENELEILLEVAENVHEQLAIILNYRSWMFSKQLEAYSMMKILYCDIGYLTSTLRRSKEQISKESLINIPALGDEDLEHIRNNLLYELDYIIEFVDSWN